MDLKELLKNLKLNESLISILFGGLVLVLVTVLFFSQTQTDKTPRLTSTPTIGDVANDIEAPTTEEPSTNGGNYTVSAGESMWSIAEKEYGSGYEWVKIASANPNVDPDVLSEGDSLVLPKDGEITESAATTETATPEPTEQPEPTPTEEPAMTESEAQSDTYVVVRGDNLWNIAVSTYGDGYRWSEIAQLNNLVNPNIIHAGNVLQLPR